MATVKLVEGGVGWLNVEVLVPGLDSNNFFRSDVRAIVDGDKLKLYTSSDAEVQFLAKNKVSTLYSPLLVPDSDGYNSGNNLLGLISLPRLRRAFVVILIV